MKTETMKMKTGIRFRKTGVRKMKTGSMKTGNFYLVFGVCLASTFSVQGKTTSCPIGFVHTGSSGVNNWCEPCDEHCTRYNKTTAPTCYNATLHRDDPEICGPCAPGFYSNPAQKGITEGNRDVLICLACPDKHSPDNPECQPHTNPLTSAPTADGADRADTGGEEGPTGKGEIEGENVDSDAKNCSVQNWKLNVVFGVFVPIFIFLIILLGISNCCWYKKTQKLKNLLTPKGQNDKESDSEEETELNGGCQPD